MSAGRFWLRNGEPGTETRPLRTAVVSQPDRPVIESVTIGTNNAKGPLSGRRLRGHGPDGQISVPPALHRWADDGRVRAPDRRHRADRDRRRRAARWQR